MTATTTPRRRSRAAPPRCSARRADRRADACSSTTPQAALQALARVVLERRRARCGSPLTVVAITGLPGQDHAPRTCWPGCWPTRARPWPPPGRSTTSSACRSRCCGRPTRPGYLVLEMGARGVGHLAELCAIAPPDISLVLNVGKAHIGEFGSQAQIAVAKGELVEALSADGRAVLNLDDPLVAAMAERTAAEVWTFGRAADGRRAPRRASQLDDLGRPSLRPDPRGRPPSTSRCSCSASTRRSTPPPSPRPRWRPGWPFAGIAASLRAIDAPLEVADGAARAPRRPGGGQRRLQRQPRLDARRPGDPRRGWAAPGGGRSRCWGRCASSAHERDEEHRQVGLLARPPRDRRGRRRGGRRRGASTTRSSRPAGRPSETRHVETTTEAGEWLRENVAGPDVVLVKASRGGRLERVADMLVDQGHDTEGEEPVS